MRSASRPLVLVLSVLLGAGWIGAFPATASAVGGLSVGDGSVYESNSGSVALFVTISLSEPAGAGGVSFDLSTADGTATAADSDYFPTFETGVEFLPGEQSFAFAIPVTGDTKPEPDEYFYVRISNVSGATLVDGEATATILNDDGPSGNEPPTFAVAAGSCATTGTGGSFLVSVADAETDVADLEFALAGNTNPALVPGDGVAVSGSGAVRTISIATAPKQSGTATLTFELDDGTDSVNVVITVQVGTDADETLTGTDGPDLLAGSQGADELVGLGGADVLCGGNGNDSLSGGPGGDTLAGENGNDILSGDDGADTLLGGRGNDMLAGGADADSFSGGVGSDTNADMNVGEGDTSDGT